MILSEPIEIANIDAYVSMHHKTRRIKVRFYVSLVVALQVLCQSLALATSYEQHELFLIKWGSGLEELKISPPVINGIVSETTAYEIEPGYGPSDVFVDRQENVIISSYEFRQIKGFDKTGQLIFNFSRNETQYDPDICRGQPAGLYVDTLLNLYIVTYPGRPFVPVVRYDGEVVDRLFPYPDTIDVTISSLSWNSFGAIFIFATFDGYMTYYQGTFTPGGSAGLKANDGNFYGTVIDENTGAYIINKYSNPDNWGNTQNITVKEIEVPADSVYSSKILYGGQGDSLYAEVCFYRENTEMRGVWVFDLDGNMLTGIDLPPVEGKYDLMISPFVAPDGSIYEFRCQDDGLHVVKWTKEQ